MRYGKCPVCGFATIYLNDKGELLSHLDMDKIDKIEMLKLDQAKELADLIESEKLRELLPDSIKHTARIVKHSDHSSVIGWDGYRNQPTFAAAWAVVKEMRDQLVEGEHWKAYGIADLMLEHREEAAK